MVIIRFYCRYYCLLDISTLLYKSIYTVEISYVIIIISPPHRRTEPESRNPLPEISRATREDLTRPAYYYCYNSVVRRKRRNISRVYNATRTTDGMPYGMNTTWCCTANAGRRFPFRAEPNKHTHARTHAHSSEHERRENAPLSRPAAGALRQRGHIAVSSSTSPNPGGKLRDTPRSFCLPAPLSAAIGARTYAFAPGP